jgi:transposase
MARYKDYSYDQHLMVPIDLHKQVLPGTFEYTLNKLIDEELDLSNFDKKYQNDEQGAPAYSPAILLKIILFAYSKGIISSRKIEQLCCENIVCIALSADSHPHFTTIADFISSMGEECKTLFTLILTVCYTENLIGKDMFAVDGCKFSSNCSKEWSGTKAQLLKKVEKIKKSVDYLVTKHKDNDDIPKEEMKKEEESIKRLKGKVVKIRNWLKTHEEKMGAQGKPIKSNITDNESATLASSHGVIQGYNGMAAVDDKNQVVVWAEAFGDNNEAGHFPGALEGIHEACKQAGIDEQIYESVKVTADSGFHSEKNMKLVFEQEIEAYIADRQFRTRDVRFNEAGKHKKKTAKWQPSVGKKYYGPKDFIFDEKRQKLICPAGHAMWLKCKNFKANGGRHQGKSYMGHIENCISCRLRSKCLRKVTTKARQVVILEVDENIRDTNYTVRMRERFDTPLGRSIYSLRMGTVEPVFGNIRGNRKLDRLTLRGKEKTNIQWLLYCMVHNIGKLQVFGSLN